MSRALILVLFAVGCSTEPLNDRMFTRPDVDSPNSDGGVADEDAADTHADDAGGKDTGLVVPELCQPNRDGMIERSEVTLTAGLTATFATARDVTWDTRGTDVGGEQTWDLADSFDTDQNVLVELRPLAGQWFEAAFADADYFTTLSTDSDLLGVFRVTDDSVLLVGVVTPEDGLLATELEYDPPVPVLQFPLQQGDSWGLESTVTGRFQGVLSVYTETYAFEVDDSGTMLTPYGMFDVLRVRSLLERQVGLLTTTVRSLAFVTECFGTIATVTSQDNESGVEFTDVSELRRIAP